MGVDDPGRLAWLDPPPAAAHAQARDLLTRLEALDEAGRITPAGRRMAALGMYPRLAHMVLRGRELGLGGLACELAALLAERDIVKAAPGSRDADLRLRVDLLRAPEEERRHLPSGLTVDRGALHRVRQTARQWQRQLGVAPAAEDPNRTGLLLAFAYPDRIAQRRPGGSGQFRLSNGHGAFVPPTESLAAEDWLGVADLDGDRREARIFLAAPLALDDLETHFAAALRSVESVAWDAREEAVLARRQRRLGALVLKDEPLPDPPADRIAAALIRGIREQGLALLPWTPELRAWQARVLFLRRVEGAAAWPDVSDEALLAGLEDWLAPYLAGMSRRAHLQRLDLRAALHGRLSWPQRQALDAAAPTHLTVPSGSRLPIRYEGETPVLAVRLQEMFGARETPAVAGGRVPLLLHLLSPAHRPVQVTRDLAGFWADSYRAVKRDLQGRYPKHAWPDDPLAAEPTRRAKPRPSRAP